MTITEKQLHRYARQVVMPEIDEKGQQALLSAKIAILGAGGLGSPVIANLATAGVGNIIICDDDVVDLSNLNRQFIYRESDVGQPKTIHAKRFIQDINLDVTVELRQEMINENSLTKILSECDVLLDCSDRFDTRHFAAKAACRNGIPHIFGGATRFDGQMATFMAGVGGYEDSACFGCIFSKDSDIRQAPNCEQAGIISPITGVIGSLQALETIKWITKSGDLNSNTLVLFDGYTCSFSSIQLNKNYNCSVCSA